MKKALIRLGIGIIIIFIVVAIWGGKTNVPLSPPFTSSLGEVLRNAWLHQQGSGMFFGTSPDLTTGTSQISYAYIGPNAGPNGDFGTGDSLNVLGLASQFPDKTTLWLKFTCPGPSGFDSLDLTFRIEMVQGNTKQYVTEFSIPVNPNTGIVRFQMPSFSVGPGDYDVSAYTNGAYRFQRRMAYLAQGQQPDPSFAGGY